MMLGFRVWDSEKKSWDNEYFNCISDSGTFFIIDHGKEVANSGNRYIAMPSTGIKARSGKEIFEGDVICYCISSDIKEIPLLNNKPILIRSSLEFIKWVGWLEGQYSLFPNCHVILMGNIYENPELLEKVK